VGRAEFIENPLSSFEFQSIEPNEVAETKEISDTIYVDVDYQGNLVSMTIEHARTNAWLQEFSCLKIGSGSHKEGVERAVDL